jgi:hypothetical protein
VSLAQRNPKVRPDSALISRPDSAPAVVVDLYKYEIAKRVAETKDAAKLNSILMNAVAKLERTTAPEVQPGHSRGNFLMRQCMVHRSFVTVRCTRFLDVVRALRLNRLGTPAKQLRKNMAQAKIFAEEIEPSVKLVFSA